MAWSRAHQWYLLLLAVLCASGVRSQGSSISNTEAAALLHIKSGFTNGDIALPDWDSDAGSPCSWKEIECFGDSIHAINISTGLRGTIAPKGWADLKGLETLDLSNNALTGTIPKLPMSLTVLSLSNNSLNGTIPTLPESLGYLDLSRNSLTGSIPYLPESLTYLDLYVNNLTGTLPKLPESLGYLDLSRNSLIGTIPKLPMNITILQLFDNHVNGTIPKLPESLGYLDLSRNILTGTIPKLPESLSYLYLYINKLTGRIPKLPDSLLVLQLGSNTLTGTIPQLPESLIEAMLSRNRLTGSLTMFDLPIALQYLGLDDNRLTGTLPMFDFPESLSILDLSDNSLSGTLPGWNASQRTKIQVLPQKGDGLCGKVPPSPKFYIGDVELIQGDLPNCTLEQPSLPSGETSGSSSSSVGIAVGLAFGCAALVAAALAVWWYVWPRRRHASNIVPDSLEPGPNSHRDPVLELTLREARLSDSGAASNPGGQNLEHLKMWLVNFNDIQLMKQIGEGAYGRVYSAKWKETLVACKILNNPPLDLYTDNSFVQPGGQSVALPNPLLQNLHKEASIMAALRHPNIMSFLGVSPSPPCILSEFCSRGSLADVLKGAQQSPQLALELHWPRRLHMMIDCAKGLLYLHERDPPIIHRDLKAANLLVDVNWKVKVADFNLSRIVAEGSILSSAQATNPRWLAPEVLNDEPASQQSDVFAYGIVLWECLTWSVPYASENPWMLATFVSNGGRPTIPPLEALPGQGTASFQGLGAYIDLIQRCWAQDPAKRPPLLDIMADLRAMLATALKQVRGPTPKEHGQDDTSDPVTLQTTQQTSADAGSKV